MMVKILFLHLFLSFMYPGKRELFIFYNQQGTPLKDKQLAELERDKDGVQDRDIVIYTFQTDTAKAEVKKHHINTAQAFTIILTGKDGGEKLKSDTFLPTAKLFATIDAMPMRKAEMKDK